MHTMQWRFGQCSGLGRVEAAETRPSCSRSSTRYGMSHRACMTSNLYAMIGMRERRVGSFGSSPMVTAVRGASTIACVSVRGACDQRAVAHKENSPWLRSFSANWAAKFSGETAHACINSYPRAHVHMCTCP